MNRQIDALKPVWGGLCLLFTILSCSELKAETARSIMEQVDHSQREANDAVFTRSRLSTCPYVVRDQRVVCSADARVKELESVQKQYGANNKDSRGISIVLAPASERGIGMLTYSYDDPDRETESWLYLSALGRVKRLSSGEEDKEPVAFFGSEFTTEDMETGKTDEYEYRILQKGPYAGTEVWVIEATPKPERVRKTNYSKVLFWVDQTRYLILRGQSYDKRGNEWKRIFAKDIEQIGGHWIARSLSVMNIRDRRISTLETDQITLDVEVEDNFLTQRTLTDLAYRERQLSALRKQAQ